ncbi:hypothetical protein FDI24_gp071 [Acidovorax phage ACP17]|uniref:Uncharacterized protein n=1 Tax=Acidovorax phage ACP17 TaxID=2010329 RepID=A0A223AIZ0_9CAUD|nr:hypothetical protein FDI24_gp071 [Acidovorax phage ACP17]ASS33935.1 hypothetical protein [Acidovorax phage ACP17]
MASTTWRVRIEGLGGPLEISEMRLCDSTGAPLDGSATVTSSQVPFVGSASTLNDGDLITATIWTEAQWRNNGFYLEVVFPTAVDVALVNFGATNKPERFPKTAVLYERVDGIDTQKAQIGDYVYPGNNTMTSVNPADGTGLTTARAVYTYVEPTVFTQFEINGAEYAFRKGTAVIRPTGETGNAVIFGNVKEKLQTGTKNFRTLVILVEEPRMRIIDQAFSDAVTGDYIFKDLLEYARYSVIAYDHKKENPAMIADNVSPVVLPP